MPRDTLAILRSSRDHVAFPVPFQFHETKGLVQRTGKAFSESHQELVSNYFSKEGRKATFGGSKIEGKKLRIFAPLRNLHSPFFRHKNSEKAMTDLKNGILSRGFSYNLKSRV